jgi:hypothetical protein
MGEQREDEGLQAVKDDFKIRRYDHYKPKNVNWFVENRHTADYRTSYDKRLIARSLVVSRRI